jgi:hypothetical protein
MLEASQRFIEKRSFRNIWHKRRQLRDQIHYLERTVPLSRSPLEIVFHMLGQTRLVQVTFAQPPKRRGTHGYQLLNLVVSKVQLIPSMECLPVDKLPESPESNNLDDARPWIDPFPRMHLFAIASVLTIQATGIYLGSSFLSVRTRMGNGRHEQSHACVSMSCFRKGPSEEENPSSDRI